MKRLLYVLLTLAWATPVYAQTSTFAIPADSLMAPVVLFPASAVNGAGQFNANLTDLGAHTLTMGGDITILGVMTSNDVLLASGRFLRWNGKSSLSSGTDGLIIIGNFGQTFGATVKVDALPTASACGAGSPAVVAGSTAWYGSVTVGTGGPLTCTITFNGTAYPSTPHCSGAVETTTAANARAMGYSATTTVLTIVPSAAWADSSVVNWVCGSSK